MAKFDLKFLDAWDSGHIKAEHYFAEDVEIGDKNYISINGSCDANESHFNIILDISTAIKFAKTLRTEINKAKEWGQDV